VRTATVNRTAAVLCAALAFAACDSTPQTASTPAAGAPASGAPADATPEDVKAAARGAYGNDAEVLGYGTFFNAGGSQALVVTRLAPAALPAGTATPAPASASQNAETAADVTHVSIIVREGDNWKEAFRADEHLKNRRGYLAGSPAAPVPAWHMVYQKTADDGFILAFTPLNPLPGSKQDPVRVAWNAKQREYDSQDASGHPLEPKNTPGGASVKMKPTP